MHAIGIAKMKLSEQKLRWIIIGLCSTAAIRVFVFAAAFPFFNNVDEQAHVDLVVKYAHAKPPRSIEPFASEAALYSAIALSPDRFRRSRRQIGTVHVNTHASAAQLREWCRKVADIGNISPDDFAFLMPENTLKTA